MSGARSGRRTLWTAGAISAAALLLVGARFTSPIKDIPAGTGYAAWELCTRSFVTGRDFARVQRDYVEPKVRQLKDIWAIERSSDRVEVKSLVPTLGHARAAIFRKGLGCTLIPPDTTEAEVRAQPFRAAPSLPPDPRPWPLGEGQVESQLLDPARRGLIERHADGIFADAAPPAPAHNPLALLVAERGHLVYERYAEGYHREQPQLGWSMTKTLTAIIAGVLERDGTLALDEPVGLPQWLGTGKHAIKWRNLLNMAPGLQWFEGYGGASDATEMLFSHANQGAWAGDRAYEAKPGKVFNYSTGFSNVAMLRMRQLLGASHQAIYNYYQGRLFAPLGIRGGVIEPDASGTPVGGARGVLRPVDWLRLGQLVLNGGRWNGQPVLREEYVAFLRAASPASADYGGSLWRQPTDHIAPKTRKRLPRDLIFFAGHMGQYVIIVPSHDLLVLSMNVSFDDHVALDLALQLVLDLIGEARPKA